MSGINRLVGKQEIYDVLFCDLLIVSIEGRKACHVNYYGIKSVRNARVDFFGIDIIPYSIYTDTQFRTSDNFLSEL